MATIGTLIGGAIGGFGDKPKVPPLPTINPGQVQRQTVQENLSALPQLGRLASQTTGVNVEQIRRALDLAIPGGFQQASGIVSSQLSGEIPEDVQRQVERLAAEQSFAGGFAGGGLGRNLTLRDLGLTSLQLQQQGLQNFQNLAQPFSNAAFNVSSMFFSPQQRLDFALNERNVRFNRNLLQSQVDAAPDPFKAALTQALINDEEQILQLAGSVVGLAAGACWVAREVYGRSIKWRIFRIWLFRKAPCWFRNLYLRYGKSFAQYISNKPKLKKIIRKWMDKIVLNYGTTY